MLGKQNITIFLAIQSEIMF